MVATNVGCVLWSGGWLLEHFDVASPWVALLGIIGKSLTAAGLLFLLFAIRCPQCRNLTTLHFMRRAPFVTCFADLKDATVCPKCGSTSNSP
jgi:hypothetical protein